MTNSIPGSVLKKLTSPQAHVVQSILALPILEEAECTVTLIRENIALVHDEYRVYQIYVDTFGEVSGNSNVVEMASNFGVTLF